ncbi:glycoside hydrolase family 97 protein [Mucilaginibacter sp. KACC 22063]|uniref:glycoside hydrolase family 97 protein n=1 Tax=Mucilaginibacter sp. KACC 22063 TaxID=3025666 RepID=UPI00236731D6|nr:glycoside hydrolase family 97 protein [Mucilaginibacter sp. KACC 22063]WDF56435.1 glycoside hydrolase family 97 catalytic domain-containing protein [Mucilaginibacter sp. KACC 22063]
MKALLTCLLVAASAVTFGQNTQTLSSPDGHIKLNLSINNHALTYNVKQDAKTVIQPSALGIASTLPQQQPFKFGTQVKRFINETYAWRGVHAKAVNKCTDLLLPVLDEKGKKVISLEARVYNDGVAFRYILPASGKVEITEDNTQFNIPVGTTIWGQADINDYEGEYQKQNIEDIKAGQLFAPPLTGKLSSGTYIAITEGGVIDFAGMSLKSGEKHTLQANLKGNIVLNGNIETPWRIIEIGSLNTLVNCDIVANVSPKPDKTLFPDGFATSWVKPGKSVWSWLTERRSVTLDNMKEFSRLAGKLGITYNLVDAGWAHWKNGNQDNFDMLKELVAYSAKQNVKIWVWKSYPLDEGVPGLEDDNYRAEFFKRCKDSGVVGIKIDYFDSEKQQVLAFYLKALKDAAKLHLMLDFHGADKPTGQSRTWPNELSREGVRGLENTVKSWPFHNTTLLFTRYLAGHADYTPLSFSEKITHGTTLTHQVATVAAFTSPFMCLAADPDSLLKSNIKDMVRDMPVTWDETIVLPATKIGEIAALARRNGTTWYLTVLNGEEAPKTANISLSFLGIGNYTTTILHDTDTRMKTAIEHSPTTNKTRLNVDLKSGGGYLAVFKK